MLRNPAVAGQFYPNNPDILEKEINSFLKEETEKEQAVAVQREMQAKQKANVEKHTIRKKAPQIRRLAMKK